MKQCPVSFPIWDLPWKNDEPCDVPHLDEQRQLVGVSIYHGQPFGMGPGAIVTSYHPRAILVDSPARLAGNHFSAGIHGPLALGWATALRFAEDLIRTESRTRAEIAQRLEPLVRGSSHDAFMQCDNSVVPAFEFGFGIPGATVIVSADLLTHPVALGFWGWQVEVPVLKLAEFDWE
jgi:hypothetical protein